MQLLRKLTSRYAALALFAALLPAVWACDHKCATSPVGGGGGGGNPGPAGAGPALASAQTFEILASSTMTGNAGVTVFGDVGVSTAGGTINGLPVGQPTGGTRHAGDGVALQAQNDVTPAYNDLAARACNVTLTGVDLGGRTLTGGVYCFASSAALTGILTLDGQGNPDAVFVFKIGSTLITAANNASVILTGQAQAKNVWWQVTSSATLNANTVFIGNIIALTTITIDTGSTITGRALARTGAVTMNANAAATLP